VVIGNQGKKTYSIALRLDSEENSIWAKWTSRVDDSDFNKVFLVASERRCHPFLLCDDTSRTGHSSPPLIDK
jgi:hypothetical protein